MLSQPLFDELVDEGRQLTDKPAIAGDVKDTERRWNMVITELERRVEVVKTAGSLWTQYTHLVTGLHEQLSAVSVRLQSNIRSNTRSTNLTLLTDVQQMNQVISLS